jgi:hypothetical protein
MLNRWAVQKPGSSLGKRLATRRSAVAIVMLAFHAEPAPTTTMIGTSSVTPDWNTGGECGFLRNWLLEEKRVRLSLRRELKLFTRLLKLLAIR